MVFVGGAILDKDVERGDVMVEECLDEDDDEAPEAIAYAKQLACHVS